MKISVYMPNWVGDAVMATPALRAVRDRFADAEIVAVLRPPMADVLAGTGLVDRTVTWSPRGGDPNARGWRLVRRLRSERFDLAVLFPNSLRSGWLAWLSGAERRVGFAKNGRGILLTDALPPKPRKPPHPVIDEYLRLVEHLGCENLTRRMELATLSEDEAALEALWDCGVARPEPSRRAWPDVRSISTAAVDAATHGTPRSHRPSPEASVRSDHALREASGSVTPPGYVCLNPGGAFGAAKHWPTNHFAELARRVAIEFGTSVLVLCGPAEREEARTIANLAGHPRVVSLASETLSIGLTKAAVRHCDLLITTDSGPRHFAAPFGIPVITLFGPTHIAWSETFYEQATHLQIPVGCGPCQKRTCPLGHHRCMTDLTVDRVFAEVIKALEANRGRRAA